MKKPHLFAAGGAHVDRRGRVHGAYIAEASNPGTMREEVGGGALNATRIAVQRGVTASLLSLRGGDAAGQAVTEAIEDACIEDLSSIFLDRTTPSYTAILTDGGDLVTGLADMALYEHGFAKQLRRRKIRDAAASADAFLCDANMSAEAVEMLAALGSGKPIYVIAVSPAKVGRLAPVLDSLSCLFMNRREAHVLAEVAAEESVRDAAFRLSDKGLKSGIITAGGGPALVLDKGELFEIAPPPIDRVVDVTGAGDALAGGTVAALMRGLPLADAVCEGMAAAKLVVESERVAPKIDDDAFRAALAAIPSIRASA